MVATAKKTEVKRNKTKQKNVNKKDQGLEKKILRGEEVLNLHFKLGWWQFDFEL